MAELGHGMGRIPSPPDNRDLKLELFLPAVTILPKSIIWSCDTVLDQKDTPHCGGFSAADWGNTRPVDDRYQIQDGHAYYYLCKEIDGEPKKENGTTIRSVARALKQRGRLQAYAFTSHSSTMVQWLLTKGPLIVGTDWTEGMSEPDYKGFIHPIGAVKGGHAYVLLGCNTKKGYFTLLNSWGQDWALNGRAKILIPEFMQLFSSDGECMTAVELPLVKGTYATASRDVSSMKVSDDVSADVLSSVRDRTVGNSLHSGVAAQASEYGNRYFVTGRRDRLGAPLFRPVCG